jgi:hypothetical protein
LPLATRGIRPERATIADDVVGIDRRERRHRRRPRVARRLRRRLAIELAGAAAVLHRLAAGHA